MVKLLCVVFLFLALVISPVSVKAQVDAYTILGAGIELTDGGASHLKYFVGGEFILKQDTAKGFTLKVRTIYTQVKNAYPEEIQGIEIWEVTEQVLSKKIWNWSISAGIGVFNEFQEGDDLQRLALKFETSIDLFRKLPLAIGVDLTPNDGRGDKEFIYAFLNYKL